MFKPEKKILNLKKNLLCKNDLKQEIFPIFDCLKIVFYFQTTLTQFALNSSSTFYLRLFNYSSEF